MMPASHQRYQPAVTTVEGAKNFSSGQLWFGKRPTGITLRRELSGQLSAAQGIELGAAVVFAQTETGHVATITYPFTTELPTLDEPPTENVLSQVQPWFGPQWLPEELVESEVVDVALDFVRFAVTTSIFWSGKPTLSRRFRRLPYLQEQTGQDIDEILRPAAPTPWFHPRSRKLSTIRGA